MQLKDAEFWKKQVEVNVSDYGKSIVDYARRWAEAMESRMADGKTVAEVAKDASHDADTDGAGGFAVGAAAAMLAQCWVHGEEFRQWFNLDTQIKHEGERANDEGGILNPALPMTIVSFDTEEKGG